MRGPSRDALLASAINMTFNVHMLHATTGRSVNRATVKLPGPDGQTVDALAVTPEGFPAFVAQLAQQFETLMRTARAPFSFDTAGVIKYVRQHQMQHGRLLYELFAFYKTVSEAHRAQINLNAYRVLSETTGESYRREEVEAAMRSFSARAAGAEA